MAEATLLGIDVGATGCKATLYSLDGRILCSGYAEYSMHSPRPSWVEEDADDWWQAAITSVRAITADPALAGTIAGVGVGCTNALVAVDAAGEPLRPAIMQLDQRTVPQADWLRAAVGAEKLFAVTGNRVAPGSYSAPLILWLKEHEPATFQAAHKFLVPSGFIAHKLTGRFSMDYSRGSTTALFDIRRRVWSGELCAAVKRLADAGVAVLLIEHRMEVVRRVAHRVLAMAEGRVLVEGSPGDVLSHPEVARSYLGQEQGAVTGPVPHRARAGAPAGRREAPSPVLEVSRLVAGYGGRPVLQGVDLQVGEGELACLLGANAAGKSTLLRAIFGSARVFSGDISLSGRRVAGWRPEDVVRAGAALVPEGRRIFARLTVKENLELGMGCLTAAPGRPGPGGIRRETAVPAHRVRAAEGMEALEGVLELFPRLRERLHQPAGSLSGGEQQMLALARALVGRPRLLCLDEPTMGLSPALAAAVLDHVREINARGTAVLLVEQAARMVASWGVTCYVLKEGRVAYRGKLDTPDLLTEVERIYLQ